MSDQTDNRRSLPDALHGVWKQATYSKTARELLHFQSVGSWFSDRVSAFGRPATDLETACAAAGVVVSFREGLGARESSG
jgi:hypothetical protein